MKRLFTITLLLALIATGIAGCDENSTGSDISRASVEKQFVWDAMNYWYFWQTDVPQLADNKAFFDGEQDFQDYLMNFSSARTLFDDLLFSPDNFRNSGLDDFSFFIDDFEEFNQSRLGNSNSFGFEFGLVRFCEGCTEIFGYVQYIVPNSPAAESDLERGDIFTRINGTELTVNNFSSMLGSPTYELTLAEINENDEIVENGETITLQRAPVTEDPVYLSKIIDTGSTKVGYLMYNSFQTNSHEKLNNVFGDFLSEGIDELVLDLRYNPGGAVFTSAVVATMVSGLDSTSTFARFTFNSKRSGRNSTISFQENLLLFNDEGNVESEITMNKLSLDRVFILTGFSTASASEGVINGLSPFMDVILIGRQTVGKDDGSLTLYDTSTPPYTDRESANPTHKNAIQPIVLKIVNTNGDTYPNGFIPDIPLNEIDFLDNLPPIGDLNDPLLARALEEIAGPPLAKLQVDRTPFPGVMFKDSRDLRKFGKEMYLTPEMAEKLISEWNSPVE